jgi:hypothetical protein
MSVIAGTSAIHAETFAKALGWGVGTSPTQGWCILCGVSPKDKELVANLRKDGVKVAGYWIGSDSLCAIQDTNFRRNVPELDLHLVVHERIQKELSLWKVESKVLYPCARNYVTSHVLPKEKTVGIYSPSPSPNDLYMHDLCVQIATENPGVKFVFYGASYDALPENARSAGRMEPDDTQDLYSQFSCILRLCLHDGFPVGGIEAKVRGLHIIENFPYPGFLYAPTVEKVNEYLHDEATFQIDSGPFPAWYRQECCKEAFKEKTWKLLDLPLP